MAAVRDPIPARRLLGRGKRGWGELDGLECGSGTAVNWRQHLVSHAFKCDVLWALLDGIGRAALDQSRNPTWMAPSASR